MRHPLISKSVQLPYFVVWLVTNHFGHWVLVQLALRQFLTMVMISKIKLLINNERFVPTVILIGLTLRKETSHGHLLYYSPLSHTHTILSLRDFISFSKHFCPLEFQYESLINWVLACLCHPMATFEADLNTMTIYVCSYKYVGKSESCASPLLTSDTRIATIVRKQLF